jgi:hypothetical protein
MCRYSEGISADWSRGRRRGNLPDRQKRWKGIRLQGLGFPARRSPLSGVSFRLGNNQ